MKVCEIFKSIQGESTYSGLPCTFIRLSGCNLKCTYCDTGYAFNNWVEMSVDEIINQVKMAGVKLIEITGGEPLMQKEETENLIKCLLDADYEVLIETNGSISIKGIDKRATIILDVKTPGSGMTHGVNFPNFDYIKQTDELKFVLCSREDYEWSKNIITKYKLEDRCRILFSPAFGLLPSKNLAGWIIEDRLHVRLNLQIHKYIFGPDEKRV
jgi:7-carboxy-7-deazaguanine synthase